MASWLKRTQAGIQSAPITPATAPTSATFIPSNYSGGKLKDPNAPDARLDVESKCIYERRLPGNAYITAHVTRLQDGFYDSPSTHGDCIDNVRFIAVAFVFHPSETINRFQAATISIALHDDTNQKFTDPSAGYKSNSFVPKRKPKFLRFAPHILYGGVSPETLDWNFNLTGSLGVSQAPVSASLSPSGGLKRSYKVYQMMRIQGSKRTLRARHHHDYDLEDGEVFWTLEENALQKSGLPREFTFIMLATKGDVENVVFEIDVEPKVASWFGHYPNWWCNLVKYLPLHTESMDIDRDLGQRFLPEIPGKGYNFANLAGTFNDYVSLPGTTVSATDHAFANQPNADPKQQGQSVGGQQKQQSQPSQQARSEGAPAGQVSSQPSQSHPGNAPSAYPQQPTASHEPFDYHIYLDNPRSINLHASSPAPASDQPQKQRLRNQQPQSQSSVPQPSAPRRPTSNTKLKRRSIDISYMSPPPSQHQRQPSLRHSHSRTDLRTTPSPLIEEPESDHSKPYPPSYSGKENESPARSSARSPQQSSLSGEPRRPARDRDSPSPVRFRRDISPYAELSKNKELQNKRYSMPAYMYVNDLDD
ncbi:hypothetical protein H2198_009493 [Neophaeococcomyces mojaviensis]|uniref:Uncharacterized protein n=1 Tax=Neophaeococcomyces mojaviensis TaxID=3383035 RepID=A0ACC2ZUB5_9EURO|nr:hypothetical protein H2198_009493 [Knufia sp. JES_112]